MRAATLLGRTVLGGYLAVHGAQKLFGAFGGSGLDGATKGFEAMGLTPARPMATLAGAAELGGGILTATGVAEPLGPLALAGSMAVAATVHRKNGAMAMKGGFELPLTNLALAAVLAGVGSDGFHIGPRLPKRLTAVAAVGAAGLNRLALSRLVQAKPAPAPAAGAPAPDQEESAA